ncbi:MAG: hypothetical protein A2133_03230 [Actinobacteria bacterium RBG_16_64_13]|nr:MAG: hypothetical protein A2133_03230 [Actinobacteria bacterium RBG_16_64_13]
MRPFYADSVAVLAACETGRCRELIRDLLQMVAAAAAGAEYVVTRNLAHFSGGPVSALSPGELLPLLEVQ